MVEVSDPQPTGCMQPRMAMNEAQHKIMTLLKILLNFVTKFDTKFYYLDICIFYISDHKYGTCSAILKDYRKSRCIIRVIMWGHSCLSVVVDNTKIMHGPFFCSSVFVSVCVFNVWPKTTLLPPAWPRDAQRLYTPAL